MNTPPFLENIPSGLRPKTIYGLSNTKGSCFVNALLQSLFYCEDFQEAIVGDKKIVLPEDFEKEFSYNPQFGKVIGDEIKIMRNIASHPKGFKEKPTMLKLLTSLKTLFILMLRPREKLFDSISTAPFSITLKSLPEFRGRNGDCKELYDFLMDPIDRNFEHSPSKLFNVPLTKYISCSCGFCKKTDEEERYLSLYRTPALMPLVGEGTNFEKAIKIAFSESELEGYRCPLCNEESCVSYRKIKTPPDNIVFFDQFYEFTDHGLRKTWEPFKLVFELNDDIMKTIFSEEVDLKGIKYRLRSAVIHLGSGPNRGHFISLARLRKDYDTWGLFNDKKVFIANSGKFIYNLMMKYNEKHPFLYMNIYSKYLE